MSAKQQHIAVIGGGAAGFFGAIICAESNPNVKVHLFEKSNKLLSKVRISGGGRCNVTHACFQPKPLSKHYPRGEKPLSKAFQTFQAVDTVKWFENHGVKLKTESDGRMFPITDDSATIIRCLMNTAHELGIQIHQQHDVQQIHKTDDGFELQFSNGIVFKAQQVLVAIGGHPKLHSYGFLAELGHAIIQPVPSLFTFHVPDKELQSLLGLSVPKAIVKVATTKLEAEGPLLITHWGLSGPAVLRLSAWGARWLAEQDYKCQLLVNWTGEARESDVQLTIQNAIKDHGKKQIGNYCPYTIPQRLWEYLLAKSAISIETRWVDIPQKLLNKLTQSLYACVLPVNGKSTYKDEFVTAGGIDLSEIDFTTMQSKLHRGLYFAGEVVDIDGITGGFNFQNAWTTGYLAGKAMAANL